MGFQNALDAYGAITYSTDSSSIDIATFVPKTVGDFSSYVLLDRIKKFFPDKKDRRKREAQAALVQFMVTYLTDDYKGSQLNSLCNFVFNKHNKKLNAKKKGMGINVKKALSNADANSGHKTFMKTS